MSNFSYFMKANKKVKENVFHPVTASLCDANGKPLDWEFRHITSKENDEIREDCTKEVPVTGKPNLYRPHVDGSKYTKELLIKSIVTPDLYNVELQNSYGVKKPDDLLMAMVDDPGEYNALVAFVQNLQGFNTSFNDLVDEAKKLIEEGDWEASFAFYALLKLHILPSQFLEMDEREKAFVIASIKIKQEDDARQKKELERKASRKGR